jgi:LssY-like putative type I secretion system component LssY
VVRGAARAAALLVLLLPAYAGIAYGVLPAVWRRHASLPEDLGLPRLSYTAEGIPADPINVAIVGTRRDVIVAMRAAGWALADRITWKSGLADARSVLFNRPYTCAPMSTHFVARRRPQDLAFDQNVGKSPRRRHHVRLWQQGEPDAQGRVLWLGAASFDRSVGVSRFTGEVMHHIDPAVDRERDKLVDDLARADRRTQVSWIPDFAIARRGRNGGGDRYVTDGRLAAVDLLRHEPEPLSGSLSDPKVSASSPERQQVAVTRVEDVARLARRVNEEAPRGVSEIDDLAIARSVGHAERSVQPVRADVHRRSISALAGLQAEERGETGHRVENPVRKACPVKALPAPLARIGAEPPPQERHPVP